MDITFGQIIVMFGMLETLIDQFDDSKKLEMDECVMDVDFKEVEWGD